MFNGSLHPCYTIGFSATLEKGQSKRRGKCKIGGFQIQGCWRKSLKRIVVRVDERIVGDSEKGELEQAAEKEAKAESERTVVSVPLF